MEHDALKVNVQGFIDSLVSRKSKGCLIAKTVIRYQYCVHFQREILH